MELPPLPVTTERLQIVDAAGRPRIVLSAESGAPSFVLIREDGNAGMSVELDYAGRPAVSLMNPEPQGPTAALEVDDKGAHVLFARPGGASSYLFLNNAGGSGVVLIDAEGRRKIMVMVSPDGTTTIERLDDAGVPLR